MASKYMEKHAMSQASGLVQMKQQTLHVTLIRMANDKRTNTGWDCASVAVCPRKNKSEKHVEKKEQESITREYERV